MAKKNGTAPAARAAASAESYVPSGVQPCKTCGAMLDLDTVPGNSRLTGLPGKFCPCCNAALDETALESTPESQGGSSAGRKNSELRAEERRARLAE